MKELLPRLRTERRDCFLEKTTFREMIQTKVFVVRGGNDVIDEVVEFLHRTGEVSAVIF